MRISRTLAVAALTAGAAFAVQYHRHTRHTRRMRAMQAAALTERLAAERAHEAYQHEVDRFVGQVVVDAQVVDAATQVIDREWARNQQGGEQDDV